jgi:glycosyltransferase involved in cell wall biosynthesis
MFAGQVEPAFALEIIAGSRALLHPPTTEEAPWALSEAAALGVPSVIFEYTGAETNIKLSTNGGIAVMSTGDLVGDFTAGIVQVLKGHTPAPTPHRDKPRILNLLESWWVVE